MIDQQQRQQQQQQSSAPLSLPISNARSLAEMDNESNHEVYTRDLNNALNYAFYHEIIRYIGQIRFLSN